RLLRLGTSRSVPRPAHGPAGAARPPSAPRGPPVRPPPPGPPARAPRPLFPPPPVLVARGPLGPGATGAALLLPDRVLRRRGLASGIAFSGFGTIVILPWLSWLIAHAG